MMQTAILLLVLIPGEFVVVNHCPPVAVQLTLSEAIDKAKADGRHLLIYVACEPQPMPGCVSVRVEEYPNAKRGTVIVGRLDGGKLLRVADLSGNADAAKILEALEPKAAPVQFVPGGNCGRRG